MSRTKEHKRERWDPALESRRKGGGGLGKKVGSGPSFDATMSVCYLQERTAQVEAYLIMEGGKPPTRLRMYYGTMHRTCRKRKDHAEGIARFELASDMRDDDGSAQENTCR